MDVPMHEAPLERQASVAAAEAELLVNAFEGSVPVPPSKAVAAMRAEGVVQMDGVMNCTTARALRAHVCARLQEIQSGDESPPDCERLLGQIMCRRMRWDLKLDLADAVVSAALEQTLAVLGQPLVSLLGCGARLFELGALAVDAGAPRQPVHPDTPFSSAISVVTVLVALQDVTLGMGPTHFLPRTHTERARAAQWGYDPTEDDEVAELLSDSTCRIPLPRTGDAVAFDARTLHCGSAHTAHGGPRRVLFYCSFMRRRGCKGWHGAGFDQPGTLLDSLRGKFCLDGAGRLVTEQDRTTPQWSVFILWALSWLAALCGLAHRALALAGDLARALHRRTRLLRGTTSHLVVVHTRGSLEVKAPARGSSSRFERVGILHQLLSPAMCTAFVNFASAAPTVVWSSSRHEQHATTDMELDAAVDKSQPDDTDTDADAARRALDVLDRELDASGAIETTLENIASTYRVDRRHLLMRELFLVRYDHDGQSSLERHRDASWFSFVIALNDSDVDFVGGGTCVRDAPPLSVGVGSCLFFVGVQQHAAAPISQGTRLVLAGFVDMRAPLRVRNECTAQMLAFDTAFVCSSCREFRRPYLRSNVRMLERCAAGRHGRKLLELLAARRVQTPCDLDLSPLEDACRRFLAGERLEDACMRKFVARVLEPHAADSRHAK